MSKYLFDCHKCTNKAVSAEGDLYCVPILSGKRGCYILSGNRGKDFVFACDYYQTEPKQMESWEMIRRKNEESTLNN